MARAKALPARGDSGTTKAITAAPIDPREIIKRSHKGVFLIAYRVWVDSEKTKVVKQGDKKSPKNQPAAKKDQPSGSAAKKKAQARKRKKGPWFLLCTAFAHGKRTLVTTGDCVYFVHMALQKKVDYFIAQNLGLSRSFRVVKLHQHSAYCHKKDGLKSNLGAIEVDRDLGISLPVASAAELAQLREKDTLYYYGFPLEATPDLKRPKASMLRGKVVRQTDVEYFEQAPHPRRFIIHHDALTNLDARGTSGSPIFATSGKVIAVQAGSHHFPLDLKAVAKTSKQTRRYSFGIRIDQMSKVLGK